MKVVLFFSPIFIFLILGCAPSGTGTRTVTYDLLLKGGRVVDGSGLPSYRADVAFKDGRVAAIGDLTYAQAAEVIPAKGLVIAPGFIDILRHNDIFWSRAEQG
ncbi:MAG: hypothetical protein ACREL1_04865, partial [bacterium]